MDKTRGFLEYRRKEPGYRPREIRLTDYKAVELRFQPTDLHQQAARCMDCGTPFCHAFGCPLANVIPELNDFVFRGRWAEALELLLSTNNFPEFTGRICPALCEASCVLGINDEPVNIRQIELMIIENAYANGLMNATPPATRRDARVAIIGSGPAGLAVADTLNAAGLTVAVFDNDQKPGGILRYGIPDFKLEKWVIDRRINLMREQGVEFKMNTLIGRDISVDRLRNMFNAICLAGGAREPRDLNIPGRELKGIYFAMDYLVQQNCRVSGEARTFSEVLHAADKDVVILGGGDTGSDCLGTALRQGARSVHQFEILPKPPATRPAQTPWPLWPQIMRESSSHKEGGTRRWSIATRQLLGKNGQVQKLRCVEVEWKAPVPGKPSEPVEIPGSEFEVHADMVILALGFTGVRKNSLIDDLGVTTDARGNILTDNLGKTNIPGLFAAGDMCRGASLVVHAIANGRITAAGIMQFLNP